MVLLRLSIEQMKGGVDSFCNTSTCVCQSGNAVAGPSAVLAVASAGAGRHSGTMIAASCLLLALSVSAQGGAATPDEAPVAPPPRPSTIAPPELVAEAALLYPEDAFREGVAGLVTMDVDLADDGTILRVAVTQAPDPRLAWAALGALTNFELLPAREVFDDGEERAIAIRFSYTLHFTIDEVERERLLAEDEAKRLREAALAAQTDAPINLTGRVRVAAEPGDVAGAIVTIEGTELEAITGEDGAFDLRGVPDGRVVILVDAPGYEPGRVALDDKKANEVTDVVVYLPRRATARNELVISERRTQREVTKRVLTQKELTRVPGTFGDAIRVVQRLPGVSRAPFGLGAVLVRGGSPEDSIVMIDGHLARYLFHLGAGPSVLNTDIVDRLEFYPGGQGARFGRAIAGAIDVVTKDPASDVWSGKATIDLLATSFRLEGPLTEDKKLAVFFAGRTSYVAEVLQASDVVTRAASSLVSGPNINLLTLAPRYADYQGKVLWKLPSLPGFNQAVTASLFGAHDSLDFALDPSQLGPAAPSNVGITTGFHRVNPVWRARSTTTNDAGEPVVRAFVSPIGEITYSENRFDASQFRLDIERFALRAEVEFRPVSGLSLALGTDDSYAIFTSQVDVPFFLPNERLFPRPVTSDPPRFLTTDEVFGTSSSFYVDSNVEVGPMTFLLGMRADLWTYYDQVRPALDPRFAFRAKLLPFTTLKGNVGLYHQTTSPFFMAKEAGNPDLPLEYGWQTGIGLETWLTRSLDVDVQFFARNANDLAEFVRGPTGFSPSGAPRIQPVGLERAYGAELLIRQRLDDGVFGWVSYTLMRSEERQLKPEGFEGAEATGWRSTEFDQTHNLSIALSSQLPYGFELGGAFRYVSGNPATLAQGGVFDADDSRHERVNRPTRADRLPPFIQVDLRVDKRFVFDTWALGLYLDLQNATNQQNFEFFQYNYDFTAIQGFPGLPILPVFGVDASF